ncbi:MAG: DNA repair and recombination protein RadB [Candidatus Hydrothermarchaeaceae archaeon]
MDKLKPFLSKPDGEKIPAGRCIDKLLNGGVETKTITQIYGPPASGKTNICLQVALSCIKKGKKVIFIDTESGHSIERVKQIAGSEFDKFIRNTLFFGPTNFGEQDKIIENLGSVISDKFGLIILDSAVSLYRIGTEEDKIHNLNRLMSKQLAKLSELARKHNLAVIVTNQVYSSQQDGSAEPIGGNILKYWSKAIIELQNDGKGVREAILIRHRSIPEGLKAKFVISSDGLRDYSETGP